MNAIKDVLVKLDPGNNDHWTAAGLPSVGAVSEMLDASVTRQEIAEAMPGFTRDTALALLTSEDDGGEEPPTVTNQTDDDGGGLNVMSGQAGSQIGMIAPGHPGDPITGLAAGLDVQHENVEVDALAMIEEALQEAQGERYSRNYELKAFVRQWQVQQHLIYENQRRLDKREADRVARRSSH